MTPTLRAGITALLSPLVGCGATSVPQAVPHTQPAPLILTEVARDIYIAPQCESGMLHVTIRLTQDLLSEASESGFAVFVDGDDHQPTGVITIHGSTSGMNIGVEVDGCAEREFALNVGGQQRWRGRIGAYRP
jgi:hypothetical protein